MRVVIETMEMSEFFCTSAESQLMCLNRAFKVELGEDTITLHYVML